MKILVIGACDSIFLYEFARRVSELRPQFCLELLDLSDKSERYDYSFLPDGTIHRLCGLKAMTAFPVLRVFRLLVLLRRELRRLGTYDYVHIQYVMPLLGLLSSVLAAKGKLICSFWGTDLLRSGWIAALLQKRLLTRSYRVTCGSSEVERVFCRKFGSDMHKKIGITHFGINALNAIDNAAKSDTEEKRIPLPQDKIIVLCGCNAFPSQQHALLLRAMTRLSPEWKKRTFFLFHFGYGGTAGYRRKIARLLKRSGLDGSVDESYMNLSEIARLRMQSDIVLFFQKRDSLSAALLEHLYAGTVPIVGSWLNYPELGQAHLLRANAHDLTSVTEYALEHLTEEKKRCLANRKAVHEIGSWDEIIGRWLCLYEQRETPDRLPTP